MKYSPKQNEWYSWISEFVIPVIVAKRDATQCNAIASRATAVCRLEDFSAQ